MILIQALNLALVKPNDTRRELDCRAAEDIKDLSDEQWVVPSKKSKSTNDVLLVSNKIQRLKKVDRAEI